MPEQNKAQQNDMHNLARRPLAVAKATILVPCYVVKSLQLIWCSGTRRFYLRMTDPQMNYSDLT